MTTFLKTVFVLGAGACLSGPCLASSVLPSFAAEVRCESWDTGTKIVTGPTASCDISRPAPPVSGEAFAGISDGMLARVLIDSEDTRRVSYSLVAGAEGYFGLDFAGAGTPALVPVWITANGAVSMMGRGVAGATVYLDGIVLGRYSANPDIACDPVGSPTYCNSTSFESTQEVFLTVGSPHSLGVQAEVESDSPGRFEALSDPFIQIDPNFLASHPDYSLTFGPGFVNGPSPVPEPAQSVALAAALAALCKRRLPIL